MTLGAVLTGCATTPDKAEPTVFTGFVKATDGSMVQKMRGFVCPAEIGGLQRARAETLLDDGSDAFCNYVSPNKEIFTFYLSDFKDLTFQQYFDSSFQEVGYAMQQSGLSYDPSLSDTCELSSLDEMSILSAFGKMKDNEMMVSNDPAAVFVGPNAISILTISDLGGRRYLKFRYSLAGEGEADTKKACDFVREQSVLQQRQIQASSGSETPEDALIRNLMDDFLSEEDPADSDASP
jgi:hypothetical protein